MAPTGQEGDMSSRRWSSGLEHRSVYCTVRIVFCGVQQMAFINVELEDDRSGTCSDNQLSGPGSQFWQILWSMSLYIYIRKMRS